MRLKHHTRRFCSSVEAAGGTAAAATEAVELTAHYQNNLSWSSTTTEATLSVCSALFTDFCVQKKKNPTTIWRQPDCPPIDALLIFALSLLYVLENVVDWIFSTQTPPLQLFALMQSPIFVYFEN